MPKHPATYLKKMAEAMKLESVYTAVKCQDPSSPNYGLGVYSNIAVLATENGLYAARTKEPQDSLARTILIAAFSGRTFTICADSEIEADKKLNLTNTYLYRLKRKFDDEELQNTFVKKKQSFPNCIQIGPGNSIKVEEVPKEIVNQILEKMSNSADDDTENMQEDIDTTPKFPTI